MIIQHPYPKKEATQIIGYTAETKAGSTESGNQKMELERQFPLALDANITHS